MLGRIRRGLHRIRYYSATREETVWTKAMDWSVLAALLLAVPATWAGDVLVHRPAGHLALRGRLARTFEGEHVAALLGDDIRTPWVGDVPLGEFVLTVDDRANGLPFVTSTERTAPELELILFSEPRAMKNVSLPADDPRRGAIEQALADDGRDDLADLWRTGGTLKQPRPIVWIASSLVWVPLLLVLLSGLVQLTRLSTLVLLRGQARRRRRLIRRGRCPECGYDLRGLEFSARCPECGELIE